MEIIKKLWNVAWDMWEQRNELYINQPLTGTLSSKKTSTIKSDRHMLSDQANWQSRLRPYENLIEHQLSLPMTSKQWLESIAAAHPQEAQSYGRRTKTDGDMGDLESSMSSTSASITLAQTHTTSQIARKGKNIIPFTLTTRSPAVQSRSLHCSAQWCNPIRSVTTLNP